jgi:predicted nucleic acid-binding protein
LPTFTAFYDASVLYPAPLRDLLMHLAVTDLFRAKWSDRVHDEWIESLLRKRPDLARERLEKTRRLMDAHVRDCLVENYEGLIPGLYLPDADDRHVLAAAIRGRADVIVTRNLKDFPKPYLWTFGIEPQHPDDFVVHLMDLAPPLVVESARKQRENLVRSPKTVGEFLATLERNELTQTASWLREYAAMI